MKSPNNTSSFSSDRNICSFDFWARRHQTERNSWFRCFVPHCNLNIPDKWRKQWKIQGKTMKTMENARQSLHPRQMEETTENGKNETMEKLPGLGKFWLQAIVFTFYQGAWQDQMRPGKAEKVLILKVLIKSNETRQDWESFDWDHFESFDQMRPSKTGKVLTGIILKVLIKWAQARLGKICVCFNDWQINWLETFYLIFVFGPTGLKYWRIK